MKLAQILKIIQKQDEKIDNVNSNFYLNLLNREATGSKIDFSSSNISYIEHFITPLNNHLFINGQTAVLKTDDKVITTKNYHEYSEQDLINHAQSVGTVRSYSLEEVSAFLVNPVKVIEFSFFSINVYDARIEGDLMPVSGDIAKFEDGLTDALMSL